MRESSKIVVVGGNRTESETFLKAIEDGNLEEAKAVFAGQCDVNYYDKLNCQKGYKDKDGKSALHKAADKGYTTIVEWLLSLGADSNISSVSPIYLRRSLHP